MVETSLPRFIRTQHGVYIAIAHIRILRCDEAGDTNPFDADGPHDVLADFDGKRAEVVGAYHNKADAVDALEWIMAQIETPGTGTAFAPPADTPRQGVDE